MNNKANAKNKISGVIRHIASPSRKSGLFNCFLIAREQKFVSERVINDREQDALYNLRSLNINAWTINGAKSIGCFVLFVKLRELSDRPLRVIDAELLEKLFRTGRMISAERAAHTSTGYPSHLALNYSASIHERTGEREALFFQYDPLAG